MPNAFIAVPEAQSKDSINVNYSDSNIQNKMDIFFVYILVHSLEYFLRRNSAS